jgi:hypothetical protein
MNEPQKPAPPVPAKGGSSVPTKIEPPASDVEFLGSRQNNPFIKNRPSSRQGTPSQNPFHNKFEPEG